MERHAPFGVHSCIKGRWSPSIAMNNPKAHHPVGFSFSEYQALPDGGAFFYGGGARIASHPFYTTKQWKAKHNTIMCRAGYQCQECKRYGRTTPAAQVHHIIPIAWCLTFNKLLALANINLIALCVGCHNKMHDRENDTLTSAGMELVDRRYGDEKPKGWEV